MLTLAVALESGGALANAPQANSRQAVHRAPSETLHAVHRLPRGGQGATRAQRRHRQREHSM